ncbi:hypothetical protein EVC11_025 [Rhizobium phage RHph_I20]|uniref:Uncharacterized protein n=1 Tax=Rhizobium phage RHph_I20 TaxID=2509730 RepID=A0A7S5RBP1_9CAUD|nr:hypothetical protein EVC11_025 [Rhizobium phage RHph_I20]
MSKFKIGDRVQFSSMDELRARIDHRDLKKHLGHVTLDTVMHVVAVSGASVFVDFGPMFPGFNIDDSRLKLAEEKPKATVFKPGDVIVFASKKDLDEWKCKASRFTSARQKIGLETKLTVHCLDGGFQPTVVVQLPNRVGELVKHHINVDRVKLAPVPMLEAGALVMFKDGDAFADCHRHKRLVEEGATAFSIFEVVGAGYTERSVLIRLHGTPGAKAHPVKITRLDLINAAASSEPKGLDAVFIVSEEGAQKQDLSPMATQEEAVSKAKSDARQFNTRQFVFKLVAVVEPPIIPEPKVEFCKA